MERTFDIWPKDDLLGFKDGRQDIVWALEKIAVWKEHFPRAARMLVKLALAENSKFGNNSTGILRGLFVTRPGLAGTQAPPIDRFPIIEELLQSPNDEDIELGLSLCEEWLNTGGGIRMVGADTKGSDESSNFGNRRRGVNCSMLGVFVGDIFGLCHAIGPLCAGNEQTEFWSTRVWNWSIPVIFLPRSWKLYQNLPMTKLPIGVILLTL